MKLNNFFKVFIVVSVASPLSFIVGDEILANHLSERFEYEVISDNLLACGGGGGGGSSPAARAAKKVKQANLYQTIQKKY